MAALDWTEILFRAGLEAPGYVETVQFLKDNPPPPRRKKTASKAAKR